MQSYGISAPIAVIATALTLGGCGSGGGISSIKNALSSSSSSTTTKTATTTTTASTSTTTTTPSTSSTTPSSTTPSPTAVAADQGNGFFVTVPDVTTGVAGAKSPNTGSKLTFGTPGTWSQVSNPASDPNVPNWIKDSLAQSSGTPPNVYKRTVSATLTGGTGGVADAAPSGNQYVMMNCLPGSSGCGSPNIDMDNFVATQSGQVVNEKTVVAGSTPVQISGKMMSQDTWVSRDPFTSPWADGPLKYSYVSSYSDQNLQFLVTSIDPNNGPQVSSITGSGTRGVAFGGTATVADDMAALKSSNVSASYQGYFRGLASPQGGITDLNNTASANSAELSGKAALTANFGAGTVTGNAYDLQRTDASNATTAAPYGLRMDGTISGSTYSGTAKYTAATTTAGASASASSPSGQMLGGFFGPKAVETTGVVRIDGTAPGTGAGTGANTGLLGSFGAKKTP